MKIKDIGALTFPCAVVVTNSGNYGIMAHKEGAIAIIWETPDRGTPIKFLTSNYWLEWAWRPTGEAGNDTVEVEPIDLKDFAKRIKREI